jgi:hypothetical protein
MNQQRHPNGWREGYLGGKYGLGSFCSQARAVPATLSTGRLPVGETIQTLGWCAGWLRRGLDG